MDMDGLNDGGVEIIEDYGLVDSQSHSRRQRTKKFQKKQRTLFQARSTGTLRLDVPIACSTTGSTDWDLFGLPRSLINALIASGYESPTEVQRRMLETEWPEMHSSRFIIAAETGSGKTLAYAIPIIARLIDDPFQVLIIAPTRELCLQIKQVFVFATAGSNVCTLPLVGGISIQKQQRLIGKNPQVIVATPGRLLALLNDEELKIKNKFRRNLRFLVLDEADRLFDQNNGTALRDISKLCIRRRSSRCPMYTFVLSATVLNNQHKLEKFRNKIVPDILIDTTGQRVQIPQGISEYRILCATDEKDYYLVYVLSTLSKTNHRTILFVNSIDQAKRLRSLLTLMKINSLVLHSHQRQKHRLSTLERFCSSIDKAVLVATDVAARGIDVLSIETVIHYNVPRSFDLYIHRSGRTGRLQTEGTTIVFVCPEETEMYRRLLSAMKKTELKDFEVNYKRMDRLRRLVQVSEEIEKRQFSIRVNSNNMDWFEHHAKECDLELDENITRKHSYCKSKCESQHMELTKLMAEREALFSNLY